jgi:autotransporter-associated beta strand protein
VPPTLGADLLASRDSRHHRSSKAVLAALLASSCLSSIDAAAQTWIGADSAYETAANWNPATVPDSGATATFSNTGVATVDVNSALTVGAFAFSANAAAYTISNMGGIDFDGAGIQNGSSNTQTIVTAGSAGLTFHATSSAGSASLVTNDGGSTTFVDSSSAGTATITTNGTGFTFFQDNSSASNATLIAQNGGTIQFLQSSNAGQARITVDNGAVTFFDTSTAGSATITTNNGGSLSFQNSSSAGNATLVTNNGGCTCFFDQSTGSQARFITNSGGVVDISGLSATGTTAGSIEGAGRYVLGSKQLTVGGNNRSTEVSGVISGRGGSLVKVGSGTLTLSGADTYTGGTNVLGGTLAVNGSLASTVTVSSGGTIGGTGTIGGLVSNGGTLAPGNSIGTLTVSGNFSQTGGTYTVEANAAGQSDRVNVGGAATIGSGATVQALAQPGAYGRSTTYTILRATGGVSGTYSSVSSNFAFLTPSLSYDANDVFLTLTLNSFDFGGRTYNQRQVGRVLDQTFGSASGDYATVLNAIAGLSTTQGPQILDAISGQNYAGFSNAMVQGAQLFMTNFANRAGSGSTAGARVALAEACDVACDATTPAVWGVWGGAVGGTGTIAGNDNAGTFTYSVGGFSGGLDRKITPNFLAGVTVGYLTGGQWTGGFEGRSVTDTVQAGLYGSFMQGPVYVDALAAYAYNSNQLWRAINIPGLQPRTAYGQASANQFLGQLEGGWRVDLGGAPGYFVTPFALLQGSVLTQNGFTESGAQSLNLSVAQQTTSSLRTIFGAQLGAAMDVGLRDRIAAQLRFGWSHEYSDTARPVTASFAGAPSVPFTVFGAAPTRDGAVIGFSASTAVAEAMGVYLRYEGNIAGQDSSHALTAGLRMTW